MKKEQLKGKRYINLVRCSTDPQAETSIPAQLEELNRIGLSYGGIHAGDVILDGVSGSKPGNRTDLTNLMERKKRDDDYEVILSLVEDRFTRGGGGHGMWAEHEFLRHGVQIIHVGSDIPDGPYGPILRTMKYEAARETARSTSLRSTSGAQRAMENGTMSTATHTPYGLYRLYLSPDKKPICIIRDMRDGTQQRLDPVTRELIQTYGIVGGGSDGHYKKQKRELVLFVWGDEVEASTVRHIEQRRWGDGWGGRRIAYELNYVLKRSAPCGGEWTQRQVDVIAENPIYCGWSLGNKSSAAGFFQRSKNGPRPVEVDPTVWATKKNLPVHQRASEDYIWQEQPYLKDFLSEPLRSVAESRIRKTWERRGDPNRSKRSYNTHADSLYLLTKFFTAKQDGKLLKGQNCGRRGHTIRYYAHPTARKDPVAAGFPNTTFRADVLEKAILNCLRETLLASPELQDELRNIVIAAKDAEKPPADEDIKSLKAKREALAKKIGVIFDIATEESMSEAKEKIAELKRQQAEIDKKLASANDIKKQTHDVETTVQSLIQRLSNLGENIEGLPIYPLRQVLAALTQSLTADMITREVEMILRVPENAISDIETAIDKLCLLHTSELPTLSTTQSIAGPIWAKIHCEFERNAQKPCYTCRRLPRAA